MPFIPAANCFMPPELILERLPANFPSLEISSSNCLFALLACVSICISSLSISVPNFSPLPLIIHGQRLSLFDNRALCK
nr:MAG TPA: hypothetical protein [Caudoviricetes sp.]